MDRLGLDTNCAGYLFEALQSSYSPSSDRDEKLKPERVALVRIFIYLNNLYEVPSLKDELEALKQKSIRENQLFHSMVLLGKSGNLDESLVSERVNSFLLHHKCQMDCRILAEAEVAGYNFLLTCDNKLIKHLRDRSRVGLFKPSEYLQRLNLSKNVMPKVTPDPQNHLASANWWKM